MHSAQCSGFQRVFDPLAVGDKRKSYNFGKTQNKAFLPHALKLAWRTATNGAFLYYIDFGTLCTKSSLAKNVVFASLAKDFVRLRSQC